MLVNSNALTALKSPVRTVEGRAEVYNADGSTTYSLRSDGYLKEFTIERIGDSSKFFGYGIMRKEYIERKRNSYDQRVFWNRRVSAHPGGRVFLAAFAVCHRLNGGNGGAGGLAGPDE